jgi:hypothetical protein
LDADERVKLGVVEVLDIRVARRPAPDRRGWMVSTFDGDDLKKK